MQDFCDTCCREIPTDAPGGLCPVCLLKAGLSDRQAEATAKTTPHSVARQVVVPNPEELQPHFPEHEILSLLGQGGMGAVYHALQTKLDRPVALKIILPETAADPSFAERFAREAKTLAKLNHPSIVGIHDFGEIEDGYYFVMEYVAGVNLRQILADGKLQQSQALSIVHQICNALQYAHDQGVIHRDIKPENILVDQDGRVKIADFGLARLNPNATGEDAERYFTLTGTHQVMGTPRYMAPEQIEASSRVDHRADIYSLGVVFYEMLTGQVPMGSFEPPSQKEAVDNRLDNVVLKAMAREPDRRYQQISSLAVDINSIAGVVAPQNEHYSTIYATNENGAAGFGTIFDRDARAVGPWVANAFTGTDGPTTTKRAPVFVMIAVCLLGIIGGLFPWAEMTAIPAGYSMAPGTVSVASVGDATAVTVAPSGSVVGDGQETTKQVLAEMQYKNIVHGFSHPLGVLAIVEFAVMALILIAIPTKRQISRGLATALMVMCVFAILGLSVYMGVASEDMDWRYNTPLPAHVEGPLRVVGTTPQPGYIVSFASAVGMLLLSAVGLRHAIAAEEEVAANSPSVV
ncbi:MAG: protein kinase, partial [Planctomycetota bacterium]